MSSTDAIRQTVSSLLQSAGHSLVLLAEPSELTRHLRVHRADLVLCEVELGERPLEDEKAELLRELNSGGAGRPPLLVLVKMRSPTQAGALFERANLTNFLAVKEGKEPDAVTLGVTVSKILGGEIFGLDRYLGPMQRSLSLRVRSSTEKDALVSQTVRFAEEAGCHTHVAEQLGTAADELVTNALYNAPVSPDGRRLYANQDRTTPVTLGEDEQVTLTLGDDGRRVGVSVTDCFGSLSVPGLVDHLGRCLSSGQARVRLDTGGAGIGLFVVFSLLHHFVINFRPGRQTEVMGIVEKQRTLRLHGEQPRSFNLFVERSEPAS